MHGTIKIQWLKNSCPERLSDFPALGKAEENTDFLLHSAHWSRQHGRMRTVASSCWAGGQEGSEQVQPGLKLGNKEWAPHSSDSREGVVWAWCHTAAIPGSVMWAWCPCSCISCCLTGRSAGNPVGRGLSSSHLGFPSCCGHHGCSLIFTHKPHKQFLCLFLMEERHSFLGSVFQFCLAARSSKTRDSVNISISLCWEVGIQFTA